MTGHPGSLPICRPCWNAASPASRAGIGVREGGLDATDRYLDMVGMTGFGSRYPDELSGGQQQRVALARSFAAGPRLILLDEPFSNLDAALRGATRREIRHLLKAAGMGIVFVTHDQEEALSFADRVAVMREGRLLQTGTPQQVYDCPADTFVATFLGRANLLTGMVVGGVCDTPLGTLQIAAPDGPATLSIRPEHLRLWLPQAGEAATGRVSTVEFKGHDSTYWIDCAGTNVQVDIMRGPRLAEGTPVVIGIAGDIHCIARS
ncbi:ABC transporter ATP-binding protein [Paenirhodobacter populi]|uniref:ABC transporter ATP-binding protein n=1 Tax=Paenirhodobacter populi TaxID=2306993 RepID=UPI0019D4C256|nr:ABC transporter ATP-binding protein [Sinirhodobacter populi]